MENKSFEDIKSNIEDWFEIANKINISEPEKLKQLYKNLIKEEFYEMMEEKINTPNDYRECMDLLWCILCYCYINKYDINLGLSSLLESNMTKLFFNNKFIGTYDSNGKLQKGDYYIKGDWDIIYNKSINK